MASSSSGSIDSWLVEWKTKKRNERNMMKGRLVNLLTDKSLENGSPTKSLPSPVKDYAP